MSVNIKDKVADLEARGMFKAAAAIKGVASAPLPTEATVFCHKTSCKTTTNVRGFFCCGNHGCDKH